MSDSHGERPGGIDISELIVIVNAIKDAFPVDLNLSIAESLVIAIQLQRNAILNDTAVINGNIADALYDLVKAEAMSDFIPGERKN